MAYDDVCNKSLFIGWVTAEPEHGQTGEVQWCNFSIGLAGGRKNEPKEYRKISAYYDNAERVKKTIGKGSLVKIDCRSKSKKWETKTGEKRESLYFVLNSFFAGDEVSRASKSNETQEKTLKEAFDDLPFEN
tara:strand:+ start:174 stop:569 length:396 start_codon:yes stop_codon:yes gene_type:complete